MGPLGRLKSVLIAVGALIALVGLLGLAFNWASTEKRLGPKTAAPAAENPETFVAAFVDGLRNDDGDFLLARLHPAVIARYGKAQCRKFVPNLFDENAQLELISVKGPAVYNYASDGKSTDVKNVFTLTVNGFVAGRSGLRDYHVARVHREFRLFVDCGDPVNES